MTRVILIISLALNAVALGAALYVRQLATDFVVGQASRQGAQMRSQFEVLRPPASPVVFLGDSITNRGMWSELLGNPRVVNRGIGGDTTARVLARLDGIYRLKPSKLFLMIGVNDLNRSVGQDEIEANFEKIFDGFDTNIPETKIFVQSVLPMNEDLVVNANARVPALNAYLQKEAAERGYRWVNLVPAFADEKGELRNDLSNDGIHLLGKGYSVWRQQIGDLVSQ